MVRWQAIGSNRGTTTDLVPAPGDNVRPEIRSGLAIQLLYLVHTGHE